MGAKKGTWWPRAKGGVITGRYSVPTGGDSQLPVRYALLCGHWRRHYLCPKGEWAFLFS